MEKIITDVEKWLESQNYGSAYDDYDGVSIYDVEMDAVDSSTGYVAQIGYDNLSNTRTDREIEEFRGRLFAASPKLLLALLRCGVDTEEVKAAIALVLPPK